MTPPIDLGHLAEASQRLVRSVDGLTGDDWTAPSLLPDWSRAHVVAHLALNGEALRDVLRGVVDYDSVPMYESQDKRDADIETLAAADSADIRERLLGVVTTFVEAVEALPEDAWEGRFERTPGGQTLPLSALPFMRLREIEVHHVDLDTGYSPDDWPRDFSENVVGSMVKRLDPEPGFRVAPDDSDRTWDVGDSTAERPVVAGPVAHLAWWLTGRRPSDRVSSSSGELPTIGAWG